MWYHPEGVAGVALPALVHGEITGVPHEGDNLLGGVFQPAPLVRVLLFHIHHVIDVYHI